LAGWPRYWMAARVPASTGGENRAGGSSRTGAAACVAAVSRKMKCGIRVMGLAGGQSPAAAEQAEDAEGGGPRGNGNMRVRCVHASMNGRKSPICLFIIAYFPGEPRSVVCEDRQEIRCDRVGDLDPNGGPRLDRASQKASREDPPQGVEATPSEPLTRKSHWPMLGQ